MLRFHWRLPQGGERSGASRAFQASLPETGLPDLAAQIDFCRAAERNGIDSLLFDFGWAKPDPMLLALPLGMATEKIKFIVAHRSGLMSPTAFVQQVNTLSALISGRVSLNMIVGQSPEEQRFYGDFLEHDKRYKRAEEFLTVCRAFWEGGGPVSFKGDYYRIENGKLNTPFVSSDRTFPELYVAGNSAPAQRLSETLGSCWMRPIDTPERLAPVVLPVLAQGKEVGLRCSVFARATREEAVRAAHALVQSAGIAFDDKSKEREFIQGSDSSAFKGAFDIAQTQWLTSFLWAGAVRSHGAQALAIVGSSEEVASAIIEYKKIGISQFILSGWPKLEEMLFFGENVQPLIREKEQHLDFVRPTIASVDDASKRLSL